jgi:tripartite-type tricarboxylate transporter receptor subunit TctC
MRIQWKKALAAIAAAAALIPCAASAQDNYPDKPIRFVLPFGAGSATDAITRVITQHLSEALKQPAIVDNRPGGNATIAAGAVAKAAPDGYTLLITSNTSHSAGPNLMKSLPYDPVKDFTSISRLANIPFMLVVDARLPVNSVDELIAYAKARPGKLAYASGNSTGIVAGSTLASGASLDLIHVPYKSTPQAMTDILGGQVAMMFIDVATGLPNVKAGKLRPLAVTTPKETSLLPGVPTLGSHPLYKGFEIFSWNALSAPAGTPSAIVNRLNAELSKIMASPAVKEKLASMAVEAVSSTPQEQDQFIARDTQNWARLVKAAGIQPE